MTSPDGLARYFGSRTSMQTGMYGLPPAAQGGEEGLPTGELFEIIPIPGNGSADLLIEIKVIASIEIVVESVENDAGAYRHVAEDWKLLKVIHESAWEFKDHIAKDEHAILRCTGLSRFRISCPAGLDATFNVLRPDPASHLPEPQNLRNSNDMGGWGDIDTNSETDVDEATGMYTGGKDDHPNNTPQDIRDAARRGDATITARVPVTNSNPGGVAKGGTNATADPEEAVHGIFSRLFDGDSSFKSPNNDNGTHPFDQGIETHPFRAGSNSGSGNHQLPSNPHQAVTTGIPGQHTTLSESRPKQSSPVRGTPRINESQWRDMGFDSEEKARLTLGDDFFGEPAHVRSQLSSKLEVSSPSIPQLNPPAQQDLLQLQPNAPQLQHLANAAHNISSSTLQPSTLKQALLAQAAAQSVQSHMEGRSSQKRNTPEEPALANGAETVKRPRFESTSVQASPRTCGAQGGECEAEEYVESPFALMWIRMNMPRPFNHGAFGVKLRQVVTGDIRMAVVSNFMVDFKWLVTACPALLSASQIVLLHGDNQSALRGQMQEVGVPAGCKVQNHSPPLPIPYGTHHSKFFLLFYPHGVRVVIHTANLIFCDCNNKTQGIFYQDFPFHNDGSASSGAEAARPNTATAGMAPVTDNSVHTDFYSALVSYVGALRLPADAFKDIERQLNRCDFSSARVALVPSIPGRHDRAVYNRFGHMRLRAILGKHTFPMHFTRAPICCQFSSMGSLTQDWLQGEFLASLSAGKAAGGTGGSGNSPLATGNTLAAPKVQDLSLVWPTADQVSKSFEGWAAGASIPGYSHNVSKPFLQPLMARWGGVFGPREQAMPHIKTFCRFRGKEIAWACLASHNLSRAAWGELQKKQSVLFIRSYELGVVFLPALESHFRQHKHRTFSCTAPSSSSSAAAPVSASGTAQAPGSSTCNRLLRCPWSSIPAVPGVVPSNRLRSTGAGPSQPEGVGLSEQEALLSNSGGGASTSLGNAAGAGASSELTEADEAAEVVFVAAGQSDGGDSNLGGKDSAVQVAGVSGRAGRVVVPLPIPYVLPPQPYRSNDVLWKVDVDSSPGVQDSLGMVRGEAGGAMYGYSQQLVQPYFDTNN